MQWHDGWLWFTVSTAIHKARDTDGDGKADEVETVLKDLPGGTGHWWRSILIHNNRLYTSVGDPGNATPDDMERKKLWSYNLDGSDKNCSPPESATRKSMPCDPEPMNSGAWTITVTGSDVPGGRGQKHSPANYRPSAG